MRRTLATMAWMPMALLVGGIAVVGALVGAVGYAVVQLAAVLMPAVEALAEIGDGHEDV